MRMVYTHSHLNGLEFIQVHKPELWAEIQMAIAEVDAETCRTEFAEEFKTSDAPRYSSVNLNARVRTAFHGLGWQESRISTQTDFLKERIAVEMQFNTHEFVACDLFLFVKHMAFFVGDQIDAGVEVLPTKQLASQMSSGIGYYEGELYNLVRQGRGVPAVPLVLIGVDA